MPAYHDQPAFELRRWSLRLLFDAAKLVLEALAEDNSAGMPPRHLCHCVACQAYWILVTTPVSCRAQALFNGFKRISLMM